MAQRKPPSGGKPAAKKGTSRPAGKPNTSASSKTAATNSKVAMSKTSAGRKPPPRKPGKSIVNQKQTPWGVIASVVAVVVFAGAVVAIVIATHKSSKSNDPYRMPEAAAAKQISGVQYHVEPNHTHVFTAVKYDTTPPTGGNHSQYWADCSGTVYSQPIANENAVHPLEHGAIWVTYRQGLPASQVATLAKQVQGQNYVFMSPYPNLKSAVSLQAWGYQLFVNSVSDPRIAQFIALKNNPKIAPEYGGSCSQPTFIQHPSTFGHPLFTATGGGGNTMSGAATP
ncbi:MAG TPA: DUF3105 domain-containing protein [Jatrophihabitans sp.]|jgi:hypothetical protein|nr:DUF3105 domain-containing protein [Jatrophihabitans sp.]